VNHRLGYVDLAWTIGRDADGKKMVWPAVSSIISRVL
jgi:hypothetical protein